ncbi:MAG: response regulator [Nitrosopumilus sp.]
MTSVVIIDDDKDIVSTISELLELHGMDVIGKGYNGLEGVELFDKLHPDIILLDLMMPKYDGLYALRKIREKDPIANVVILTGDLPKSAEKEIKSLNPTKILFKPIDVGVLVDSFLVESDNLMLVKIKYKFKEDTKFYTCILTYEQYKNFRELPIVKECKAIKEAEKIFEDHHDKMQKALDLAAKNDTSYLLELSEIV